MLSVQPVLGSLKNLIFRKKPRLILLAATMTALCLATIRLGHQPLWLDEAIVFFRAHLSIPELMEHTLNRGYQGPFYFLIMKVWLIFGDSEFWMRFFSTLCFTLTVPVVYAIGRTVSSRRAGLYAAFLVATAPFLFPFAREGQKYMILTFFCSLALMSVALIISRTDRPPAVIGSGLRGQWHRWRRGAAVSHSCRGSILWATYIVAVLGGMLSHDTAVLLPVVTTLIFLVAIAAAPQRRWLRLRNLITANAVVLVLYLLYVPWLLNAAGRVAKQWEETTLPLYEILKTFSQVYGNQHLPVQALVLAALYALALWGWRQREDWRWVGFTLIGSLGLPLMLLVATVIYVPVFWPRVIIWTSIPFYVGCAVGLARLPNVGRYIALAGLLLCNLYGVLNEYSREPREPWDRVTQTVAEAASSDSAVIFCPNYLVQPFNYYWRRQERELAAFGIENLAVSPLLASASDVENLAVSPLLASASDEVSKWRLMGEPRDLGDLVSLLDDHSELWIIDRAPCDLSALQDALSDRVKLVTERSFGNYIKLFVYVHGADRPVERG